MRATLKRKMDWRLVPLHADWEWPGQKCCADITNLSRPTHTFHSRRVKGGNGEFICADWGCSRTQISCGEAFSPPPPLSLGPGGLFWKSRKTAHAVEWPAYFQVKGRNLCNCELSAGQRRHAALPECNLWPERLPSRANCWTLRAKKTK